MSRRRKRRVRPRRSARPIFLRPGSHRPALLIAFDASAWVVGFTTTVVVRGLDGEAWGDLRRLAYFVPLIVMSQVWVGILVGLYRDGRWVGSRYDLTGVAGCTALVTALLILLDIWYLEQVMPLTTTSAAAGMAFTLMAAGRWCWRLVSARRLAGRRKFGHAEAQRDAWHSVRSWP